jgi:hypothetical protein
MKMMMRASLTRPCLSCLFSPCLLQGELDELEREEFFRLKKVQSNKKKHAELAEAIEAARRKLENGSATQNRPSNLLDQQPAADIIY